MVNAARARLAIIGERAVDSLAESLEGDNPRIRSNAMPLLALIRDPRGRDALMAMLLDRDPRMREIASRCLGRFPSRETVVALERLLKSEPNRDVCVATVHALVEQYAAGQERAIRMVVEILFETDGDPRVRTAALALLRELRPARRRTLVRRLKNDPAEEVAHLAREAEHAPDPAEDQKRAATRALVNDLGSNDFAVWNEAVHRLTALGVAAVDPLVAEMRRRAHDPEYGVRAGMVLRALGPRRGRVLETALHQVEEPLPLQVLVEAVGAIGEKSLVYQLEGLIERIGRGRLRSVDANGFDSMQQVRARAHLELARIGSRVAIQDLRDAIREPKGRLPLEMLAAVEAIGKKDELPDLLRTYAREDRYVQGRIAVVVRTIMKRERIRRNNRMFRSLSPRQRRALESILPPLRRAKRKTTPRRSSAR